MDCEDFVVVVDVEDKMLVYSNWLGLMKGILSIDINKGGKIFICVMYEDRIYYSV